MGVRTGCKQGTPSWVDIATTDQGAAERFYSSLFGWSWETIPLGDNQSYAMAQLDGLYVAAIGTLPREEQERGIPSRWQTHVTVDNVDQAVGRVTDAGGMVFAVPFDIFDAGRMAVVADPTGGVVSLWQAKNHIGAQLVNEPGTSVKTKKNKATSPEGLHARPAIAQASSGSTPRSGQHLLPPALESP
jgi:predicted enzyme related to lactoylglutathione lyase